MSFETSGRIVFYGVDWQSIEPDGRPQDGDVDFVVAHLERVDPIFYSEPLAAALKALGMG